MSNIRIGLIGSGYMGRTYAECLKRYCKGGELAAVHGGGRAPKLAQDYEVDLVDTYQAMLDRKDIDGLLIATPHSAHLEQVTLAAKAGKHVLVEKPMALNKAECDAMIKACKDAGVTLAVIQTVRFRGSIARGKKLVKEGKIGDVRMIQVRTLFPWVPITGQTWSEREAEGGLVLDQGAHNFDFMRFFADSEATHVFGRIKDYNKGSYPHPTAMAQVEFKNGVMGQSFMSFELPQPGIPQTQFRALVIGSKGMLDMDGYGQINISLDGKPWELHWEQPTIDYINKPLDPNRLEAFFTQVQDFVDCLREKRPPAVTGEDGCAAVAIIDAVRKSNATGLAVEMGK